MPGAAHVRGWPPPSTDRSFGRWIRPDWTLPDTFGGVCEERTPQVMSACAQSAPSPLTPSSQDDVDWAIGIVTVHGR